LSSPADIAIHPNGDLYIADTYNHRIRRVDRSGIITTVAGTGNSSTPDDGIPAIFANLNHPSGIAFDAAGNLYIADTDHDRIRRVDGATGIITTVAGTGLGGYGGDGQAATQARINGLSFAIIPSDRKKLTCNSITDMLSVRSQGRSRLAITVHRTVRRR
jgi:hypothetical protein